MSTITDHYNSVEDFETTLNAAEANADTDWEEEFTESIRERFEQWGERMYLSESQADHLERIAGK